MDSKPSVAVIALGLFGCSETKPIINVPSDDATYFDEATELQSNGYVQIHTKRMGSSGVSHAIRIIDCEARTFAYIYDSDDEPKVFPVLNGETPDSDLLEGSISYWVSGYACQKEGYSVAGWQS